MLGSVRRAWYVCAAAAGSAAVALFLFRVVTGGIGAALADWQALLLVALVGGGIAAAAIALVYAIYRPLLEEVGARLTGFLKGPSSQPLFGRLPKDRPGEDLAALLAPLENLCQAYRKAIADRVEQEQTIESLRTLLGRVDPEKAPRLTFVERASGSSRNMVARLTPNLHWMTATPALQQFLHCPVAVLNGRPFADHVHAEARDLVARAFEEALDSGEAHNVIFPVVTAKGEERHVNMDVLTRYTEDGTPLQLRCYFVDITDRARAEHELRRRTEELSQTNERLRRINEDLERLKESYRDLYHNAPVMFFSLDTRGHFVTLNDTMVRTLGYEREHLLKHPYTRVLSPASREAWEKQKDGSPTHDLAEEGEVETQWIKTDGSVIDVWIRSMPIRDQAGRFVRSRSAALDVTERNRLANELRQRGDELERANAELRVINSELEDFTSVVSHDLKEPLRTLQAFSNFLAEDFAGQLGPDGFEYINHLVQASRRMGTLIDDLLTLSWAGRITQAPQSFNLTESVATVRRDLADLILRKTATLQIDGALPTVVGDPQRITQLLANLIGNALKYNNQPNPLVVIGEAKPGEMSTNGSRRIVSGHVVIFVRDNGIGIDPRYHDQIFGVFRRLHQTDEYEGTGAGLAICKKIVEAHAGQIWLESKPGEGSVFYFTLPRAAAESGENGNGVPRPQAMEQATTGEVANGAPGSAPATEDRPCCLLVEDMPEIALIAQKLGQRAGHEVLWRRSGEEAWELLQQRRPDLLLLDIHLPGMSGLELCERVRQVPALSEVPIALFTQFQRAEDLARGQAAGADHVLSKDLLCQPEAWERRLKEILAQRRQPVAP